MAGDKQIKISFAVDETSARKAKSLIDDLTRSVEKLMRASSQSGGASFSNKPILPGSGGAGHRAATGAQKGKGPNVVANILGGDSRELQGMIRGTEQAFRTVSGNIRTFVGKAEQDISRLGRAVDRLNSKMGKMGGAIGGGGTGGLSLGGQGESLFEGQGGRGTAGTAAAPGAAAGKGKKAASGKGAAIQNILQQSGMGGANQAFSFLKRGGPLLGLAGAGLAAYHFLSSGAQDQEIARLQYDINEPIAAQQRMGTIASMGNQLYQAGRGGDFRYILAEQAAKKDTAAQVSIRQSAEKRVMLKLRQAGIEDKNKIRQTAKRGKDAVTGNVESFVGEGIQWWSEALGGKRGEGYTGFRKDDGSATTSKSKMDIQREVFQKEVQADMAQDQMKLIQAKQQLVDQRRASTLSRLYGGALGDVQVDRAGFLSGGYIRDKEGNIVGDRGLRREARLKKGGWTRAQLSSARSALKRRAGFDYNQGWSVMGAQSGGFDNIVDVIRGGGVIGGGIDAGNRMQKFVQSAIGRGAMDIGVGTNFIGGMIGRAEQMATRGDFGFTGTNTPFIQSAADFVNAGGVFDSAQQRRRAGMFNAGLAENNNLRNKAGVHKATNMVASMVAAGGYGALSDRIENMDLQELAGYAKGGKMDKGLQSLGFDKKMAQRALKLRTGSMWLKGESLVDSGYYGDGPAKKTFEKFRDVYGKDINKMLKDETKGIEGRKEREQAKQGILETLGIFAEGGTAAVFSMAGLTKKGFSKDLGGRGAWGTGPRGAQKAALETQAEQTELDSQTADNSTSGQLREAGKAAARGERARESAAASAAGGIAAQTRAFSDAMSAMVRAIRGATNQIKKIR